MATLRTPHWPSHCPLSLCWECSSEVCHIVTPSSFPRSYHSLSLAPLLEPQGKAAGRMRDGNCGNRQCTCKYQSAPEVYSRTLDLATRSHHAAKARYTID
ncbi:unnamed protein product [Protopolystoma xenopodis]|uniref:Uncharacterized protein n=1 Tax=Protopolystoma xenopodis TaxID=117903 RepID=A0A448XIT9_9PLAT|nr:unnamed protein product [Protopolystoma xenopodis]